MHLCLLSVSAVGLAAIMGCTSGSYSLPAPIRGGQGACPSRPETSAGTTAIVGGTVIDGNGGPPLFDATILIRGQCIAAIGPRAAVPIPQGVHVIAAAGKFVTPGLIATNWQMLPNGLSEGKGVSLDTVPYDGLWKTYEDRFADVAVQGLQVALKYGITTVRSSFGPLQPYKEARAAIAQGQRVGARFLISGNIVGWGGVWSRTFLNFLAPAKSKIQLTDWKKHFNAMFTHGTGEELLAMSPEELRKAIEIYLDKGPDFIKYGATYHAFDTTSVFSPEQQVAIVEAVHRRGILVETHADGITAKRAAIRAGVDLIQHPEIDGLDDELIRLLVERKVICSINFRGEAENIRRLVAGGCIISFAIDAVLPGPSGSNMREDYLAAKPMFAALEQAVRLGMTPGQVVVAATKHGAIACGALQKYGTLEVGKYADLLVLDADPLANVTNFRKLSLVMKEGQVIDRERLPSHPVYDMEH